MPKRIDIPAGTTFGRLTVTAETWIQRSSGCVVRAMICLCECGQTKTVTVSNLNSGHTRSCGCFHRDIIPDADRKRGEVPLHGKQAHGRVARVDDEDYDLVMQYHWRVLEQAREPGRKQSGPYAITSLPSPGGGRREKSIMMHVLIMGRVGIDHINGNGLDNRRSNLRPASNSQNKANTARYHGSSGFKGAYRHKGTGRWNAQIRVNGRTRSLGTFTDAADAARAYDAAAREAFGEFARLNFPDEAA